MSAITFTSKYQNLHMDRANKDAMITVNLRVNSNLAFSSTPYLFYEYDHGYDYTPQFWGRWDATFPNTFTAPTPEDLTARAFGRVDYGSAEPQAALYYEVDSKSVRLYFHFDGNFPGSRPNPTGLTATFSGYLFANDRTNQEYGK